MRLISGDIFRISSVWMSCQREEGKKADWNPSKKKKIRGQEKSAELADAA